MKGSALIVTATAATAMALAACTGGTPGSGPLFLSVDGQARVTPDAEEAILVDGDRRLELGSRIEVLQGTAVLEYPDGSVFELREGREQREDSRVEANDRLRVEAGDVLAITGDASVTAAAGPATVTIESGAAKVSRALAITTQVYEGDATVTSAGKELAVPALRQAAISSARLVPATPAPLTYDATDPWDQRFLGDAITFGDTLNAKARGFTANLTPGEGRSPGFYALLLPELDSQPGFDGTLINDRRSPGETLVGAAIVAEADGDSEPGRFRARWQSVFTFRDAGAEWGLVALDSKVDHAALLDRIDAAIGRAPLLAAPNLPLPGEPPGGPAPGPGPNGDGSSPPPSPPTTNGDGPPPPPPTAPPTTASCPENEGNSTQSALGPRTAAECPPNRGIGDLIDLGEPQSSESVDTVRKLLGGILGLFDLGQTQDLSNAEAPTAGQPVAPSAPTSAVDADPAPPTTATTVVTTTTSPVPTVTVTVPRVSLLDDIVQALAAGFGLA